MGFQGRKAERWVVSVHMWTYIELCRNHVSFEQLLVYIFESITTDCCYWLG